MDTSKLGRFCNLERRFSLAALKRNMTGHYNTKQILGSKAFSQDRYTVYTYIQLEMGN